MSSISRTPSIYQILHIESGKVYVGSAINPHQRWIEHKSRLANNIHNSRHLQNAWNKYGAHAFVFEILEPVLFIEDLVAREQYWLDKTHAADPRYGYNMSPTAASVSGYKHSEATRTKSSAVKRALSADPVVRARLIEQSREYWSRPDSREKMRAQKQQHATNPETRAKMAAAQREIAKRPGVRERMSERSRAVMASPERRARAADVASTQTYILTDPNGATYEIRNLKAFCEAHGLVCRCLHYVMQGVRATHKGWRCQRKES